MFYALYDQQQKLFQRTGHLYDSVHNWWSFPPLGAHFPFTTRFVQSTAEALYRMMKEYPKPEFGITSVYIPSDARVDPTVENTRVLQETIEDRAFSRLLKFTKPDFPTTKHASDVLIVAPLSGHYATLLRDTVKSMLPYCNAVYITDWKNAREVPLDKGIFHFNTYVHELEAYMDTIGSRVHVMAVCQPVVQVLIAAARQHNHPMRPLSMTLMGGPVDARQSPTVVDNYATKHDLNWFKSRVIDHVPVGYPGAGRRVYPGFLQHFGFIAMNPSRHHNAYKDFYKHLLEGDKSSAEKHRMFYDEYNAVLDMDAAFYLETLDEVFMKFSLAKGEMVMDGNPVDPGKINDIPLFTIEGEKDDIAGVGQTKAAHGLCTGLPDHQKEHWEVPGVGHYGIFSGTRFRTEIAPRIAAWQKKHSSPTKKR